MKYTEEEKADFKYAFLKPLLQYLKDEKADLEKRGLIPTLDEAIADLEEQLNKNI